MYTYRIINFSSNIEEINELRKSWKQETKNEEKRNNFYDKCFFLVIILVAIGVIYISISYKNYKEKLEKQKTIDKQIEMIKDLKK